ncbi:MAG: type II toxin-antitoxin system VapC family toxin [Verrucomicrobia bacterium]|jgi:predicted nucleic acid-binding protein|nr:type II toxin-antitoxin system VapC family toxin [Verrucomicrobiota bacterium]
MIAYLDTSVILSRFLGQSNALHKWGDWEKAYASTLTRVEFHRTIDRLRLDGSISDNERVSLHSHFRILWQATHHIPLTQSILDRAADPFPTVVGTLDAMHLASALVVAAGGDTPTMLTHDQQLARAASAVGLDVSGI